MIQPSHTYRRWLPAVLLLCAAAAVLFWCTASSPLYLLNDWTDPNTYLTMGRGMMRGAVPYRDLFDHKGPLLYFIFGLGDLILSGFSGVFLMQILSLACTLYFIYRTALSLTGLMGRSILCALVAPFFVLTAEIYSLPSLRDYGGGSAEEFCLPFFACAVWLVAEHRDRLVLPRWALVTIGAAAGCVLQIKFNLLLFFIGLLFPLLFDLLLKREWKALGQSVLYLAAGGLASLAPYVLYALCTGSLDDCYQVYIAFNRDYAVGDGLGPLPWIKQTFYRFYVRLCQEPVLTPGLILGAVGLLALRGPWRWRLSIFCGYLAMMFSIYCGRIILYNQIPLLPVAAFGAMAVAVWLPKLHVNQAVAVAGQSILAILLLVAAVRQNQLLSYKPLAGSGEVSCQQEIAQLIRSGPYQQPTLLEAAMLNRGFYNTLDITPSERYFYLPNIAYDVYPDVLDSQLKAIQEEHTDYVVIQSLEPALTPELCDPADIKGQIALAAFEHYDLAGRVTGTGPVSHLFYYLFQRK